MAGLTERFVELVRAAVGLRSDPVPDIMRLGLYPATVRSCASDGSMCDVSPDDERIANEKNVQVLVGIPGAQAVVTPGARVLLGWRRGDPAMPYCVPSWENGATVLKLTLNAQTIQLGADSLNAAQNGVVLGQGVDPFTGATYAALGSASTTILAKKV